MAFIIHNFTTKVRIVKSMVIVNIVGFTQYLMEIEFYEIISLILQIIQVSIDYRKCSLSFMRNHFINN